MPDRKSDTRPRREPVLSVCLIARNEAERLPATLGSVGAVASEIVVVDTGSTDDTVEVARRYGARVVEKPWRRDFSGARNTSLDAATGDWILSLDADERLVEGQTPMLKRLLAGRADAYYVRIRSPLAGREVGRTFVHRFPRLFRNRPEFRFRGRVHEQILPALEAAGARVLTSDLRIEHVGYAVDTSQTREKLRRNLELLQMDLEDRPDDAYVCYHLGETYALLDEPERARRAYEAALGIGGLPKEHRAAAHQNLAAVLLKLGELDPAATEAETALRVDGGTSLALLVLGSANCRMGRYAEAVRAVDRYLKRARRASGRASVLMGFEPDLGQAYLIRGESLFRSGRVQEARRDARKAIEEAPHLASGRRLMARVLASEGEFGGAAEHLRRAVEMEPGRAETWRDLALAHLESGDPDQALLALDAGIRQIEQPMLYDCQGLLRIKAGDLRGAIVSYRRVLELEPRSSKTHRRLAGLYQKLGDSRRAQEHLAEFDALTERRHLLPERLPDISRNERCQGAKVSTETCD